MYISYCFRYFYFSHRNIMGQDRLLIVTPELEHTNYPVVKFKLKTSHSNLYDYMTAKYSSLINQPKSVFRRKYVNDEIFSYSKETAEEIIAYTFEKLGSIDDCDKFEMVKRTMKNSNKMLLRIANDGFLICASHLLHDGVSIFNTTTYISSEKELMRLPEFHYIPIYNEFQTLYGLGRSLINGIPKQHLSLDYPQEKSDNCKIIKSKIPLSYIKGLKSKASEAIGEKISFAVVFSALQALSIFYSTNKSMITIGIVV